MKTLSTAITILAVILLSSSGLLISHAATTSSAQTPSYNNSSQSLSLNLQGVITSAGHQSWSVSGGSLVGAQIGSEVVPPGATLQYSMNANDKGMSSSGSFMVSLTGTGIDGQSVSFTASGQIVGMIPSICFPGYDSPNAAGVCPSTDQTAIPAFFEAPVVATETIGTTTTTAQLVLLIESPIMSPWGAPIVITSTDGSVSIVTTYQSATATWSNVKLAATLSGTFNNQPASGTLYQVSNAVENFVTGTEYEWGTVAFQNMSPSSLNSQGLYMGNSSVPMAGSFDCSAQAGLPEGTCTETGLSSTGSFYMMGQGGSYTTGSYYVNWPAPSVTYSGTITATVKSW
jgi:hypothetical protein